MTIPALRALELEMRPTLASYEMRLEPEKRKLSTPSGTFFLLAEWDEKYCVELIDRIIAGIIRQRPYARAIVAESSPDIT